MADKLIAVPEGMIAQIGWDPRRRLNKMFLPFSIEKDGRLMMASMCKLSKPALRLFTEMLSQLTGVNRVVFMSTELKATEEYKELEQAQLIFRPTALQHRRRKGFTTILVNPNFVLTPDESMYELWNTVSTNGLSAPSPPPCGGLEEAIKPGV